MKQVFLENLKPGMILAKDVVDRVGRPVLRAGVKLSSSHLQTFKIWRIASVYIETDTPEADETSPAHGGAGANSALKTRTETRLKQLFRNADLAHPLMQQLYAYAEQRAMRTWLRRESANGGKS